MDPMALAGMIFTLILVVLIGGIIVLFPITKRLGLLLESKLQERGKPPALAPADTARLLEAVAALEAEVRRLAERQEFTERLVSGREAGALPLPEPASARRPT
ncbi:MAG TPA: hypothetical protein VFQ38_06470 [Longimicrobiales bacterium]|nr:hypothetical protein [Longimicrobiales bacterium]